MKQSLGRFHEKNSKINNIEINPMNSFHEVLVNLHSILADKLK